MAIPYQRVISANAYKNNGGTVVMGGNATTTGGGPNGPNVTNVPDLTNIVRNDVYYGSKVPNAETNATIAAGSDTKPTYKPISAGTYRNFPERNFLIRGSTSPTTIAGVANTIMQSPGRRGRTRSIHYLESRRTIRITGWDYATGAATIGSVASDSFGQDHAARPTASIPGEWAYVVGKPVTQADYPARYLW
jgi:hypothetical protein